MSVDMSVADRLKRARKLAGYETATAAAHSLAVREPTYYAHENGTRSINPKAAQRYCSKFKVPLNWLLTGQGDPSSKKPRHIELFESLTAENKQMAIDFMEMLLGKQRV